MAGKTDDRLRKLLTVHQKAPEAPKKKKKEPAGLKYDPEDVVEMSESELVELAHLVGFETASRLLPREELVDLVWFQRESPVPEDQVQSIRERTAKFVQDNQRLMASSMPCNLDCPACPSRIVIECYTVNHDLVD